MKSTNSIFHSAYFIGFGLGVIESCATHPLWTLCIRIQQKKPFVLNPKILYCGFFADVLSIAPSMAIQVGVNNSLHQLLFPRRTAKATVMQQNSIALAAGMSSSIFICPSEMIKTQQANHNIGTVNAIKHIYTKGGIKHFFKGMSALSMREGLFALSFLSSQPLLANWLISKELNTPTSYLLSAFISGLFAAISSQGFDVTKTALQTSYTQEGLFETMAAIFRTHGVQGFQAGASARIPLIIVSTYIMSFQQFYVQYNSGNSSSGSEEKNEHTRAAYS